MSALFGSAQGGLLGSLAGGSSTSIEDVLEKSGLSSGFLQDFVSGWLKLDITTLAAVLTIFGIISSAIPAVQKAAVKVYWWITRFFTASVSINSNDRLNREVLNWLGAQVLPRQATRILTARSELIENDSWHYRRKTKRDDTQTQNRHPIHYLPTFGTTWFIYNRNVFIVRRIPTADTTASRMGDIPFEYALAPEGSEPLLVMCLGRSVAPIKSFLDACRDFADHQREKCITVRSVKERYGDHGWDTTILRPLRPLETIHFDEQTKSDIVADIRNYLDPATRRFYQARGIPYRRGYLLHGPAGTGKTSLSLALAGKFGLELYLLHVPSIRSDTELEGLFCTLPPRCFILLEDIDAVGIKRRHESENSDDEDDDDDEAEAERERNRYTSRITLSGLLNVLDGVASQEGRIVLMTSNFAEQLDRALVRPGRIDRMIFLGNISPASARGMFLRMYSPDEETDAAAAEVVGEKDGVKEQKLEELADQFSTAIPDDTFTPAQLQGFLLMHRNAPRQAADRIQKWVVEEKGRLEEAKRRAERVAAAKKRRKAKRLAKTAEAHAEMVEKLNAAAEREAKKKKDETKQVEAEADQADEADDEKEEAKSGRQTPASEGQGSDGNYETIEHPSKSDTEEI